MLATPLEKIGRIRLDRALIERIHDRAGKFVLAITGGGSSAIAGLLGVAGASRTVIEATVPYDAASLADYIGGPPDQACSGKTARAMAMAAFQRARRFEPDVTGIYGVGCSAALTTDRDRRGTDRCYVALQSIDATREYALTLSRTRRDREAQEHACAGQVIRVMARALSIDCDSADLFADETLSEASQVARPAWQSLFSGRLVCTNVKMEHPKLVFPGAFNPMHEGHQEMIRVAKVLTGHDALLEISTFNVDKPPLDYMDMQARCDGIGKAYPLAFTNAPTFTEKAALFPGTVFMVGSDTLERIGQARYYGNSNDQRDLAIAKLAAAGVRFLVFGRLVNDEFRGLEAVDIPESLRALSDAVPEQDFRLDVSSSAIRQDA